MINLKTILVAIALFTCMLKVQSQNLTGSDWKELIGYLIDEKWENASKACENHLKKYKNSDSNNEVDQLRYMYIHALAGQIGEQTIDRKKAIKIVKKFEGTKMLLPSHPVKECLFDCLWYTKETPETLFTCAANKDATFIHSFEYFTLQEPIKLEDLGGKMCGIVGVLESIELQGETLSAFKIVMRDCIIYQD